MDAAIGNRRISIVQTWIIINSDDSSTSGNGKGVSRDGICANLFSGNTPDNIITTRETLSLYSGNGTSLEEEMSDTFPMSVRAKKNSKKYNKTRANKTVSYHSKSMQTTFWVFKMCVYIMCYIINILFMLNILFQLHFILLT